MTDEPAVITEFWFVYGASDVPLDRDNFKHWVDCDVPAAEVLNGVKQIEVQAYGDTNPPNAFVGVTAVTRERAVEVWNRCVKCLVLRSWFAVDEPGPVVELIVRDL